MLIGRLFIAMAASATLAGAAQAQPANSLTVSISGSGSVISSPAGINCGATCSTSYASSSSNFTLTATAGSGYTFSGWSGGCGSSTHNPIPVPMNSSYSCTATFTATTSGGTPPPEWVDSGGGNGSPILPPIELTRSTSSPGTSSGSATLPARLFSRRDLLFAMRRSSATSTTNADGALTLQVTVRSGARVLFVFNPVTREINVQKVKAPRHGVRGRRSGSSATDLGSRRSEAAVASIPAAPTVTVVGPSSVDRTSVTLEATAPDGRSGSVILPFILATPGTPSDLAAASIDTSETFGTGASSAPVLSWDGRIVAFQSSAANLATDSSYGTDQITRFSVPIGTVDLMSAFSFMGSVSDLPAYGGPSLNPALSADGRFLAFASDAQNVGVFHPVPAARQVYLTRGDQALTRLTSPSPQAVLADNTGKLYTAASDRPALSMDGTWIAFESDVADLVAETTAGVRQVYLKNTTTGAVSLVSATASGTAGNGGSYRPTISDDGRYVLFESDAGNLGTTSAVRQIYLKDTTTGAVSLVSAGPNGVPGNAASTVARISADGRYISFESDATNLVSGVSPTIRQVYVRVIDAGTTVLASIGVDANPAGAAATGAAISGDGRFVVFKSGATNLTTGAAPAKVQVYVRDLFARVTSLVSKDADGVSANGDCDTPTISGNGRVIAFASLATNLDGDETHGVSQVYLAANPIAPPVSSGWWWDASRPGGGYGIEERGNALFLGSFDYAADGSPLWKVASEPAIGTGHFAGRLEQYANGQGLNDTYRAPVLTGTASQTALSVSGQMSGSMTSPIGVTAVQRFEFVSGAATTGQVAGYPETGWWFNPSEPGRGLFLEVQGTSMFAVIFAYATSGQATWYLAQGEMTSPTAFSASLEVCVVALGTSSASCSSGSDRVALAFTSTLAGSLAFPDGTSVPIERFRF